MPYFSLFVLSSIFSIKMSLTFLSNRKSYNNWNDTAQRKVFPFGFHRRELHTISAQIITYCEINKLDNYNPCEYCFLCKRDKTVFLITLNFIRFLIYKETNIECLPENYSSKCIKYEFIKENEYILTLYARMINKLGHFVETPPPPNIWCLLNRNITL